MRAKALRWTTPNLCCSSMIANPSLAKATEDSINACVPTTTSTVPSATCRIRARRWTAGTPWANSPVRTPSGDKYSVNTR